MADAEAVFDISYFRNNPLPFYALAHELYPGKYKPTVSHSFVRLLSDKNLLLKLFTQNIDCLDREAGVPADKIVEAHGSFASQRCINCSTSYPEDLMKKAIINSEVPHCLTPECNGLVKPDIVFFGEQLPEEFHSNRSLPRTADLCIVMGTSLTVQPFASLPGLCPEGVPRVLINMEKVGGLGSRADDILILEDCDSGVRKLASALGWEKELEALWKATRAGEIHLDEGVVDMTGKSKKEELNDQINRLAEEIDESMRLSNSHRDWLEMQLSDKQEKWVQRGGARSPAELVYESQSETETITQKSTDDYSFKAPISSTSETSDKGLDVHTEKHEHPGNNSNNSEESKIIYLAGVPVEL